MNPFTWDKKTGRYRRPNGTFVSHAEVQALIDQVLDRELRNVRQLVVDLRGGVISLKVWRQNMRDMVKNVHLYSAAAAKGGWGQLTAADYGRVGATVRKEYKYLERLAAGVSKGTIPLDGNFTVRSIMYAEAGRDTFFNVLTASMSNAGKTEERNILHATESCSGCRGETSRGWVKLGELIPIGRRNCLRRCRCTKEFR